MVFGCDEGCGPKKKASEKVSDAAKDLFYRHGIRAIGVDEIVSQAGVTKPSLYRTYASKDELITACLREQAAEGQALFEQAVASAPCNPRAQLLNAVKAYAELGADQEFRGCPVSNAVVEFPDPNHPVHLFARQLKQESRDRLLSLVRELQVDDPEGLTNGLILLFEGAAAACQSYGCTGPGTALVQSAEALIDSFVRASTAADRS